MRAACRFDEELSCLRGGNLPAYPGEKDMNLSRLTDVHHDRAAEAIGQYDILRAFMQDRQLIWPVLMRVATAASTAIQ